MSGSIDVNGAWATLRGVDQQCLEDTLRVWHPQRWFSRAFREHRWDGKITLHKGNKYPAGLTELVLEWFDEHHVARPRVHGLTEKNMPDPNIVTADYLKTADGYPMWDHQIRVVQEMLAAPRGYGKSPTGCHRKGQLLLMFDGSLKRVEDVRVGDKLMGPDSTPREVLRLCRGRDQMFRITPKKGASFVVNGDHMLTLVRTNSAMYRGSRRDQKNGQLVDVTVRDWLTWSKTQKHLHKQFRVGVDFPRQPINLISPYLVGILLGDGCLRNRQVSVTTADAEVVSELRAEARGWGLRLREQLDGVRTPSYHFVGKNWKSNSLLDEVRDLGLADLLSGDKYIPAVYRTAHKQERLELLAGLIDSDGHLQGNCYELISKSERLARDFAFVARSVGLCAVVHPREMRKPDGTFAVYWRVHLSGDVDTIPCRIARKQAQPRRQKKDALRTGFTVEALGEEPYFGFALDGDRRYLLDDFTVTHNSGKTMMIGAIAKFLWEQRGWRTLVIVPGKELAAQTVEAFRNYQGFDIPVGQCGDDKKEIETVTVGTAQTLIGFMPRKRGKKRLRPDMRLRDMILHWEVLILDETHHASSETWYQIAMMSGAVRRYGLSGTPVRDEEINDLRLMGATGPMLCEIDAQELVEKGLTAKAKIAMIASPNASGPTLPKIKETIVLPNGREIEQEKDMSYAEAYKVGVVESEYHNQTVLRCTQWMVDHDRRTLVLCRRKAHFKRLEAMLEEAGIQFIAIWGDSEVEEREQAKRMMDLGGGAGVHVVLATGIWDEGKDVPTIEAMILAEGVKSIVNVVQRIGRGKRRKKGLNEVWVVDIVPVCHKRLSDHALARCEIYESEGYDVLGIGWPDEGELPLGPLLPFANWEEWDNG